MFVLDFNRCRVGLLVIQMSHFNKFYINIF